MDQDYVPKYFTEVKIDSKNYVPGYPQCKGCSFLIIHVRGCTAPAGECLYPTEQREVMPLSVGAFPTPK